MEEPMPAEDLAWTGERLVTTCHSPLVYEHLHRYALDELQVVQAQVRSAQKQMDRLREKISRKLILPFGRSQRTLQQLTASRHADD